MFLLYNSNYFNYQFIVAPTPEVTTTVPTTTTKDPSLHYATKCVVDPNSGVPSQSLSGSIILDYNVCWLFSF